MPAELEWRMWRQLRGAFKIDRFVFMPIVDEMCNTGLDQYKTVEEALESCEGHRVFLEPTGVKTLAELPMGDIVLILSNTSLNNLKYAKPEETYRIQTPFRTHLYGTNAAAIALAFREGQGS